MRSLCSPPSVRQLEITLRVCIHIRMQLTARYNHMLLTKGVSGPGKPQGRDAALGKPMIKTLQIIIPHTLNQKGSKSIFPLFPILTIPSEIIRGQSEVLGYDYRVWYLTACETCQQTGHPTHCSWHMAFSLQWILLCHAYYKPLTVKSRGRSE